MDRHIWKYAKVFRASIRPVNFTRPPQNPPSKVRIPTVPPHTFTMEAHHQADLIHFGCRRFWGKLCRKTTPQPPHQCVTVPIKNHGRPNWKQLPRPNHRLELRARIRWHFHARPRAQSAAQVSIPGTETTNTLAVQMDSAIVRLTHSIRETAGHHPALKRQQHNSLPTSFWQATVLCTCHWQHGARHTRRPWQRTDAEHKNNHNWGNTPPQSHGNVPWCQGPFLLK